MHVRSNEVVQCQCDATTCGGREQHDRDRLEQPGKAEVTDFSPHEEGQDTQVEYRDQCCCKGNSTNAERADQQPIKDSFDDYCGHRNVIRRCRIMLCVVNTRDQITGNVEEY